MRDFLMGQAGKERLSVVSRVLAAVFGGFALANVTAIGLAAVLPMARADAVLTGLLSSFLFYCLAVIWAFSTRSVWRAWAGILAWTMVFALIAVIFRSGAGQ